MSKANLTRCDANGCEASTSSVPPSHAGFHSVEWDGSVYDVCRERANVMRAMLPMKGRAPERPGCRCSFQAQLQAQAAMGQHR